LTLLAVLSLLLSRLSLLLLLSGLSLLLAVSILIALFAQLHFASQGFKIVSQLACAIQRILHALALSSP